MILFDAIRNLIDVRFTGTHAIHGLIHNETKRICALSNFNISPKIALEKSKEEFSSQFTTVFNLQKIIILNESLRPRMRARQAFPVNFILMNDFIYEDSTQIPPEMVTIAELATEKVAAVDFIARYINEMRRPHNSVALFLQQKIYAAKAAESIRIMRQVRRFEREKRADPPNEEILRTFSPYVSDYADSMDISFFKAAEIIEKKSRQEDKDLLKSEHERVRMYHEIGESDDVETLRSYVKEFITRNHIHIDSSHHKH
jgi:hypothetical protein